MYYRTAIHDYDSQLLLVSVSVVVARIGNVVSSICWLYA